MPDTVNNHPTDHGNTNSIDRFLNVVEAEKQGHDKLKSWLNVRALDIVLKRLTKEMDSVCVPDVYKRPHTRISHGIQAPIGDRRSQPFIHSVGSDFEDEQTETRREKCVVWRKARRSE